MDCVSIDEGKDQWIVSRDEGKCKWIVRVEMRERASGLCK